MDVVDPLHSVKKNGLMLKLVEEQTPEICLAAVQQNGFAIVYAQFQSREIQLAAFEQSGGDAIRMCRDPEEMVINIAFHFMPIATC